MENINLNKKIDYILLFPEREIYDSIFVYKKIIVKTNLFIIFEPNSNTDEITVSTKEKIEMQDSENILNFTEFNNKKLTSIWYCKNDQGYLDQIILGIDLIRPSLSLLCECGLIGLYENKAIEIDSSRIK